ncbi:MAG: NAD(P)H-hydrate epimerase, partial [Dehalococcoidia bacterium]|nr:NAD(P)H-hydrate epimerase [Dehalococcoidia bacterium]
MKLVTAAEMQRIEERCVESGISEDNLMENAGVAVAEAIRDTPEMKPDIYGKRIVALIGSGNNGSDGLIACRLLSIWGARVAVFICAPRKSSDPKRDLAEDSGVTIIDGLSQGGIKSLKSKLQTTDLVIDAVLGTGNSRPIAEPLSSLLLCAVESQARVMAVDLPTGLNSDSGKFDNSGLPADITLMLGYPKLGTATLTDSKVLGEKIVLDIGIPKGLDSQVKTELLTKDLAVSMLPQRPDQG